MLTQVKSIAMKDFQSWSDNAGNMMFQSDVINLIKGRNETGKSVIFKVIYEMCFAGYHGAGMLVRRGKEYGVLLIKLFDGTELLFQLWKSGARVFYLQAPGETEPRIWKNQEMPREFEESLGLLISYENKIILNVIDKDIPTPFIKTDEHYNASVFRSILEPQKLTSFFEKSKEYLMDMKDAKVMTQRKYDYFDAKQSALEYVNEYELRETQRVLSAYNVPYRLVIDLNNSLVDVHEVLSAKPAPFEWDLEYSDKLVELLDSIRGHIALTKEVVSTKVVTPKVSDKKLMFIREELLDLQMIEDFILSVDTLKSFEPKSKPQLAVDTDLLFELLTCVTDCSDSISITVTSKPNKPFAVDLRNVDKLFSVLREVSFIYKETVDVVSSIKACENNKRDMTANMALLLAAEEQLGVCPTCGRTFNE